MFFVSRAAGAVWNLAFPFVVINGVPLAASREHDAFEWFAEILIPAVVGIGTLVATFVAVIVSHRATLLSRAVEEQRLRAEVSRDRRDSRERLQAMAIEEARALTRWVNAVGTNRHWAYMKLEDVGSAAHAPTLAAEARALLQQSLVPGSESVLDLVELNVTHMFDYRPDPIYMPDRYIYGGAPGHAGSPTLDTHVPDVRRRRLLADIRRWGMDPQLAQSHIQDELRKARTEPETYWDYRRGLGHAGLQPLSLLPDPPNDSSRAQWLTDRGVSLTRENL